MTHAALAKANEVVVARTLTDGQHGGSGQTTVQCDMQSIDSKAEQMLSKALLLYACSNPSVSWRDDTILISLI